MASKEALRREYQARINRAIDHIEQNLDRPLKIEDISAAANFSPYHFHRIFSAAVGEPIYRFVRRVRLEKAAAYLVQNPSKSITEITYDCGFSSPATFARAFKELFGYSASDWREGAWKDYSKNRKAKGKNRKTVGKNREESSSDSPYFSGAINDDFFHYQERFMMQKEPKISAEVEIRDFPATTVAYVRHIGPYAQNETLFQELFGKLFMWAGPRDLIKMPDTKTMTIYHDDPNLTDQEKLRISCCISVPDDTEVDGEIGKMQIPAGKYAAAKFEIDSMQYGDAWDFVYGKWLPESGYQPDDRPCFENYLNDPNSHPEGKHIVEIYAPVKPL